uniref:Uncharacterized protein n=1 Tax=Rhizophora mucronata TaxID=61149 RepID=A0A2P2R0A1_RHIMU
MLRRASRNPKWPLIEPGHKKNAYFFLAVIMALV